jgi:two-component system, CitB family, sensor kinase
MRSPLSSKTAKRRFTGSGRASSPRMHVIVGLLELGRYQEAESFVNEVSGATAGLAAELETKISSPLVVALLVAKTTVAVERGVNLAVTDDSGLEVDQDQANALVSIIGNLVDNAIDAAANGGPNGPLATVTVRFLQDAQHSVVEVADTGPAIPSAARESIFTDGWSTTSAPGGRPRGLGLALVRQIAQRLGGDVSVAEGSGAVLRVTLPRRVIAVSR